MNNPKGQELRKGQVYTSALHPTQQIRIVSVEPEFLDGHVTIEWLAGFPEQAEAPLPQLGRIAGCGPHGRVLSEFSELVA